MFLRAGCPSFWVLVMELRTSNSAPAGVIFTQVPLSCSPSQPRSIASLRPAPYSAGLAVSRPMNG